MGTIRLSGIIHESLVNGPGMRRVFFSQGCNHNCPGCFNPDTHSFTGGILYDIDELVYDVLQNPLIEGITFSGGDPFQQAEAFGELAEKLATYNLWVYTGYTFEELVGIGLHLHGSNPIKLLYHANVIIDGEYDLHLTDGDLQYRGSTNQRIIDMTNTLKNRKVCLYLKGGE